MAAWILESHGVTHRRLWKQRIMRAHSPPREDADLPITDPVAEICELAWQEAIAFDQQEIDTEHLLLALLVLGTDSIATLAELDVDPKMVRHEISEISSRMAQLQKGSSPGEETEPVNDPPGDLDGGQDSTDESPLAAVPTHPDRPTNRDELGRARLAEVLAERIRRTRGENTEAPVETWSQRRRKLRDERRASRAAGSFMTHVYAPWGAGKSSFLRFLARDLRNRPSPKFGDPVQRAWGAIRPRTATDPALSRWIVVEFDAWRHQRLVPPWWWLLADLRRACRRELWQVNRVRWAWFWIRDIAWQAWNARAALLAGLLLAGLLAVAWMLDWFGLADKSLSAVQAILLALGSAITLLTGVLGFARGTGRWLAVDSAERAAKFLKRSHDPLGVYRSRFRWLVRSSGYPIVVFIDDLDRCQPHYVVELLEGVQTLFTEEPVTYVVAADRTWLCESFRSTYREFGETIGEPGRSLGFLFLEKTFQISLEIPPVPEKAKERYWNALLGDGTSPTDEQTHPQALRRAFSKASTEAAVEATVAELAGEFSEDALRSAAVRRLNAPALHEQLETLLSEFIPMLENNPRSMKRLMNAYGLERDRLLREGYLLTKEQRQQLALLTILRMRWPDLADHLRRAPEDVKYFVGTGELPQSGHRYESIFSHPELQPLFDGSAVEARLDVELLRGFPHE